MPAYIVDPYVTGVLIGAGVAVVLGFGRALIGKLRERRTR